MIDKRQILIEKSIKLSLQCHVFEQNWKQMFSDTDKLKQIAIRSLKNPLNKNYNLGDINKISDDTLIDMIMNNGAQKNFICLL